jgi:hypothetical protein
MWRDVLHKAAWIPTSSPQSRLYRAIPAVLSRSPNFAAKPNYPRRPAPDPRRDIRSSGLRNGVLRPPVAQPRSLSREASPLHSRGSSPTAPRSVASSQGSTLPRGVSSVGLYYLVARSADPPSWGGESTLSDPVSARLDWFWPSSSVWRVRQGMENKGADRDVRKERWAREGSTQVSYVVANQS